MTLLSDIDGGLASMETGLGRASEIAADAERGAHEIAARATVQGFVGIAHTVDRVRQAILDVRGALAQLSAAVGVVRTPVHTASETRSPQQTLEALASALAALNDVHEQIGAALAAVRGLAKLAASGLAGGQPGPLTARITGVHSVLVAVGRRGVSVRASMEAALDEARHAGAADRAGGVDPAVPPAGQAPEELPPPPRYDPAKGDEIRPYCGYDKAVGRLYPAGSDQPASDLIFSGTRGPGTGGPGLTAPWRHYESLTDHTEGHAAAIMRRDGIRDAVLYLNMHPCMKPAGCHNNIEKALPRGYRLTVWIVNANGSRMRRVYHGNGEGTAP